jgi:ubiquinone/menaquinone biosynthesis C-methylase UbiE
MNSPVSISAVQSQRRYYERSAGCYDALHPKGGEHELALMLLQGLIDYHEYQSVLDVGSGTGRALVVLRKSFPRLKITGIEPVAAMREVGFAKGLPEDVLLEGDATALDFVDESFDMVCAFGVLHHLPQPRTALKEMLRVARRGIFISDMNSFGMGSYGSKRIKRAIAALGLTRWMTFLQTGGKTYRETEDDGIWYPYSLFEDYGWLGKRCSAVHVMNLDGGGRSPLFDAPHVAFFGQKRLRAA